MKYIVNFSYLKNDRLRTDARVIEAKDADSAKKVADTTLKAEYGEGNYRVRKASPFLP